MRNTTVDTEPTQEVINCDLLCVSVDLPSIEENS